jgi:hypothetical protein
MPHVAQLRWWCVCRVETEQHFTDAAETDPYVRNTDLGSRIERTL